MNLLRLRRERGSVLVLVAAGIFPMMLLLAFATDVPHWFDYSRNLQNRADAAALAAGDQFGGVCGNSPTAATMAPIGKMAQLYSGPPGSGSDLPYPYSGLGSPLAQFPSYSGYQNIPNLTVSNDGGNGQHYHVLLNADNFWSTSGSGTNFAIGTVCAGDPTLDKTDKECYGAAKPLQGNLANDCATGPMVDVKATQDSVPLFFPFVGQPTISAHARVTLQGIGQATALRPLGVRDPGSIPCIKVNFIPVGGTGTAPATQTVQLHVNASLTGSTGPVVWDNARDNGGVGDAVTMPSGWDLYVQTILYAQGADKTCATVSNPLNYEQSSGILYLDSFPQTSLGTLPNNAAPKIDTGGVTLGGSCTPDQYFSSTGNCTLSVTANVAFPANAGTTTVTAVDTSTGNSIQLAQQGTTNTWAGSGLTVDSLSGQHPICIQVSETGGGASGKSPCPGGPKSGSAAIISLGVRQQAFAACNEDFDNCSSGDPNISGPITLAEISEGANSTIGAFAAGMHNLIVRLDIQGLQDASPSDRCANGPKQCTLLRVDQGNADGMVDCGEGNGASNARLAMLFGCPLVGAAGSATTTPCTNTPYCGAWIQSLDGSCNNATRTGTSSVDCVNTNNNGATMPECIGALVAAATGGTINSNNCHESGGSGCSDDNWLLGNPIPADDPRVITSFILFKGDISGATGNHDLPIRTFASFYVTGWQVHGNGGVTCPPGAGANEPAPSNLPNNADAIWGHWITYVEVGGGGNGQPCKLNAFGDCAPALTR